MLIGWFDEAGVGAVGIVAVELLFLGWLWLRARRRTPESPLVADAVRLGLRQGRGRAGLGV